MIRERGRACKPASNRATENNVEVVEGYEDVTPKAEPDGQFCEGPLLVQDQDGKVVNLADYKDKVVVLEWFNNECPYVVKFYKNGDMNKWADAYKKETGIGLNYQSVGSRAGIRQILARLEELGKELLDAYALWDELDSRSK